jgi:hypothetical protein
VILQQLRFGWILLAAMVFAGTAHGQIDPEKRRLLQIGYNQPLEGRGPMAAYGFFYYNQPHFYRTNLTLRLAVAPIYVDAELGISGLLGPNTDMAFGLAGGGFADSYSEIREGVYRREESFVGHNGEASATIIHRFNPSWAVPFWYVGKASVRSELFEEDTHTASNFVIPDDLSSFNFKSGFRLGGREPTLDTPLALELSLWYEGHFRNEYGQYGYGHDRELEAHTHLFWGRTMMKYTFDPGEQYFDLGLVIGTSVQPDRLSAFRLGGMLPFVSEFPLSIPGYYYQEISAERFGLLNAEYSFALESTRSWRLAFLGAAARVSYLPGLEQPGAWHTGLGGGITYASPKRSWFVRLVYGHGFQALRQGEEGANAVALLFQYDFDASRRDTARPFEPVMNPYRSRGGERLFK